MDWLYDLAGASRLQILTLCGPQSPFQGTPGTGGHEAKSEETILI